MISESFINNLFKPGMNSDSSHKLWRYDLMSQLKGAAQGCSTPSNLMEPCTNTSRSNLLQVTKNKPFG